MDSEIQEWYAILQGKTLERPNLQKVVMETIDYIFENCISKFPDTDLKVNFLPLENEKVKRIIAVNPTIPEIEKGSETSFDAIFQVLVMIPYTLFKNDVSMYANLEAFYEVVDFFKDVADFKYFRVKSITNVSPKDHRAGRGYVYTFELNVSYNYNLNQECEEVDDDM